MRPLVLSALLVSSVALSACGGGGGGCTPGIDTGMGVGGLGASCTATSGGTSNSASTPSVSVNGQALPPTTTTNTGNTSNISATEGEVTLALQADVLINPKDTPARSKLTITTGATDASKTAKIEIDTHSPENGSWPIPKTQKWYKDGTQSYLDPASAGMPGAAATAYPALDANGAALLMGGRYNEYRAKTAAYDEALQVWTFNNSYIAQYREGAGNGTRQAWTFGGTSTNAKTNRSDMPNGGTVTFNGQFTSTAKSTNWERLMVVDEFRTMNINNIWSVSGDASATVDFGLTKDNVSVNLDPKFWRTWQTEGNFKGFNYVDVDMAEATTPCFVSNGLCGLTEQQRRNWGNYAGFMSSNITLTGTLSTPKAADNSDLPGNNIVGTANLPSSFLTGDVNPYYGSLYGTSANMEMVGVFAVDGSTIDPFGGNTAINDPRGATLSHSGALHVGNPNPVP